MQKILTRALERLASVGSGPGYKSLLQALLTQGLVKIGESDVTVVCRKDDVSLVQEVLPAALASAREKTGNQSLNATLTSKFHLAPARSAANQGDACSGGGAAERARRPNSVQSDSRRTTLDCLQATIAGFARDALWQKRK